MAASYLWAWDNSISDWAKVQVDPAGKLLISDLDPFTVQQTTPMNLRHVPHGYYAVGNTYLPYAVDVDGKLVISGGGGGTLASLTDVDLTGLANGDFIYYDSGSATWKRIAHKDATTGVHGLGIGVRAYRNAAQSIPNATWTIVALNSERYDTDTIHDLVTNNSRLTCKTAGKYIIVFNFAILSSGSVIAKILLNNTTVICYGSMVAVDNTVASSMMAMVTIWDMAVNDYVEAGIYQNSGGALNLLYQAGNSPEFMMQRIG